MFTFILSLFFFFHPTTVQAKSFLPQSFRADYEQTIKKKISGKLKKTRGKIEYLYPGNIRFEQFQPENVIWVSNPRTTWFYQAPFIEKEPGHLKVTPTKGESPSKIFDLLKNGLNDNKSYTVKKNKNDIELFFNPKEIILNFQKAVLTFEGPHIFKNLRSIKIVEKSGTPLILNFKSININTKFQKQHFIFKPPPNTRIEKP